MGRRTGDAMTRVRNGNEDAAVTQNEQGTKHCRPVVSGLLVVVGCSRSRPGERDGEGQSAAVRPVRALSLQYYKAMTQHIPLIPYYNTFGIFFMTLLCRTRS